jgi:hypothetical protein
MSEPGLIGRYLAALSARLPAGIVDELADGLAETQQAYLRRGLTADGAAEAAVAEFGEPDVIAAAFTRAHPARLTARRLLFAGPAVGGCWAAALITGHAWDWPVPTPTHLVLGLALLSIIGLLAVGAVGTRYRRTVRAGVAGCAGISALDAALIIGVCLTIPVMTWVTVAAIAASLARITLVAGTLRPALTWGRQPGA